MVHTDCCMMFIHSSVINTHIYDCCTVNIFDKNNVKTEDDGSRIHNCCMADWQPMTPTQMMKADDVMTVQEAGGGITRQQRQCGHSDSVDEGCTTDMASRQ